MHLEASLLYRLHDGRANEVFQKVGTTYAEIILAPNFRSVMRQVTAAHTAATFYSEGREKVIIVGNPRNGLPLMLPGQ